LISYPMLLNLHLKAALLSVYRGQEVRLNWKCVIRAQAFPNRNCRTCSSGFIVSEGRRLAHTKAQVLVWRLCRNSCVCMEARYVSQARLTWARLSPFRFPLVIIT